MPFVNISYCSHRNENQLNEWTKLKKTKNEKIKEKRQVDANVKRKAVSKRSHSAVSLCFSALLKINRHTNNINGEPNDRFERNARHRSKGKRNHKRNTNQNIVGNNFKCFSIKVINRNWKHIIIYWKAFNNEFYRRISSMTMMMSTSANDDNDDDDVTAGKCIHFDARVYEWFLFHRRNVEKRIKIPPHFLLLLLPFLFVSCVRRYSHWSSVRHSSPSRHTCTLTSTSVCLLLFGPFQITAEAKAYVINLKIDWIKYQNPIRINIFDGICLPVVKQWKGCYSNKPISCCFSHYIFLFFRSPVSFLVRLSFVGHLWMSVCSTVDLFSFIRFWRCDENT